MAAWAAWALQVQGKRRELALVQEPIQEEAQEAGVESHAVDEPPCADPQDPHQERHQVQVGMVVVPVAAKSEDRDHAVLDEIQVAALCNPR